MQSRVPTYYINAYYIESMKFSTVISKVPRVRLFVRQDAIPCYDFVFEDNEQGWECCNQLRDTLANILSHIEINEAPPSKEVMDRRKDRLAKDEELRKQYNALVKSDGLTEAEFWLSRPQKTPYEAVNRKVVQTRFFFDERAAKQKKKSDKGDTIVFNQSEKHMIFMKHPAVRRAFKSLVPVPLSEEEFWGKYVKSAYFHSHQTLSNTDNIFASFERAGDANILGADDVGRGRSHLQVLHPKSDLVANEDFDGFHGNRALHDNADVDNNNTRTSATLSIMRTFNLHATLIAQNTTSTDQTCREELDDLKGESKVEYQKLSMHEKRYTHEKGKRVAASGGKGEYDPRHRSLEAMKKQLANAQQNKDVRLDLVPPVSDEAYREEFAALNDACKESAQTVSYTQLIHHASIEELRQNSSQGASEYKDTLKAQFTHMNELLRHLWMTYPHLKTGLNGVQAKKVVRLVDALRKSVQQLREFKEGLPRTIPDFQQLIAAVNGLLNAQVERALAQWEPIAEAPQRAPVPVSGGKRDAESMLSPSDPKRARLN